MKFPLYRLVAPALCALLAAASGGCATDGDSGDEPGGGAAARTRGGSDSEGALLGDAVRITAIDRSTMNTDGKVRYTVENVSGVDQEDLAWTVSFVFPMGESERELGVSAAEETTAEKSLVLLRGEKNKVLEAQCGAFGDRRARGQQVTGTHLNVTTNQPVMTTARRPETGTPGTRFATGRIECVAMSDIYAPGDQLTIEFENVSTTKVGNLELQVVFIDAAGKAISRSKWRAIPAMAPAARAKATVDLAGLDMGDRSFLVKVRQRAL